MVNIKQAPYPLCLVMAIFLKILITRCSILLIVSFRRVIFFPDVCNKISCLPCCGIRENSISCAKFMSKKKFLLLCPATFNLYELIVKDRVYLGYDVTHIEHEGSGFTYKSFGERVYNCIRKVFLGDRTYKLTLRNQYISYRQWEIFNANLPFDYALVIRPDLFDKQFIEAIGNQSKLMIGFQFDGVSRNPEVLDYRPLFSQFYVFDPSDVETYPNHNFSYSPNFYFDYPDADLYSESDPYSVYYVSTYHKSRIEDLIIVHTALSKHYEKIKFCVLIPPENVQFLPEYVLQHMQVMHKNETYEEHLKQVANSEIIV